MEKGIPVFFRRTYKALIVILLAIGFFVFYNTYLVDRSLINLQLALDEASACQNVQDFEKIKPFLKIPLFKEIAKMATNTKSLAALEITQNIASTAKDKEQIEDIKFYLKSLINAKEKERGGILSFLDRLNSRIFKPTLESPEKHLQKEAEAILRKIKATRNVQDRQKLYFDLENIYIELKDVPQAEEALRRIIEIEPSNLLALKAKFNLGWAYKHYGKFEKAVALFRQIYEETTQGEFPAFSKYQVADIFYKKGSFEEARNSYARLSEENPLFSLADLALYEAGYISYYNLNDRNTALKFFADLEDKFPKAKVVQHVTSKIRPAMAKEYRDKGYALLAQGKYLEAIDAFNMALQIAPQDAESLSALAMALLWINQINSAVEKARSAIAAAEEDIALINSLFVYIMTNRYDEAIKKGEEVLARGIGKSRPELYYNLGCAYLKKNFLPKAIDYFNKALKLNRDYVPAINNMGSAYWKNRNYAEAIKRFKEALAIDPKYAKSHYNLGIVYFYTNRLKEAYAEFKIASELMPEHPKIKKYLQRISKTLEFTPE